MKLFVENGYLIEAFRHDEETSSYDHFVNECEWTEQQFSEIEDYDFYMLEIVATDLSDISKTGSVYIGGCCAECWQEDVKNGVSGYLPQLVEEAIKEAKQ